MCEDCAAHFSDLRGLLDALGESYTINFRLVRGIDYYTKTVFEVWAEGIGAQAAVCGGGRYDGLSEALDGPSVPGVGFGSGIERIVLGLQEQELAPPPASPPPVFVAHFGGATKEAAVKLTYRLREAGIGTQTAFARDRRSMKSQMREANRQGARFVIILGDEEVAQGLVTVRPLDGGDQQQMPAADLAEWLAVQVP